MFNNKGTALFITMAVVLLLAILVIVVLLTAYNYSQISFKLISRAKAISAAESGISYAYWKVRTDPTFNPSQASPDTSLYINGHQVSVWIDSSSGRTKVRSKVVY